MTVESEEAAEQKNEEAAEQKNEEAAVEEAVAESNDAADTSTQDVDVNTPEYQSFNDGNASNEGSDLTRLQNVQIKVAAELGRATLPIQELMKLTAGSVLELDRTIDSPVDLIAQGVKLASGEVVVVDGHFAIRILKVYDNK